MENHKGLRKYLKYSLFYTFLMNILGTKKASNWLYKNFYSIDNYSKLTDIGCGPGSFFENFDKLLPSHFQYHGIDPINSYIETAKSKFGKIAKFYHGTTENFLDSNEFKDSDIIICSGVLHHLDDLQVSSVLNFAQNNLKPETGRLLAIEPVHLIKESKLSTLVMKLDRGMHIRTEPEWKKLLKSSSLSYTTNIITGLIRIPYNHILIKGTGVDSID